MSHKYTIAVLLAVITVFTCTNAWAKSNILGIDEQRHLVLNAPTLVGGTLLPAGNYTIKHQMDGQAHLMIFKQVNGTAEAKVACNLVQLKKKADQSTVRYITNDKHQRVLQEMTFAGDSATHVLVP